QHGSRDPLHGVRELGAWQVEEVHQREHEEHAGVSVPCPHGVLLPAGEIADGFLPPVRVVSSAQPPCATVGSRIIAAMGRMFAGSIGCSPFSGGGWPRKLAV